MPDPHPNKPKPTSPRLGPQPVRTVRSVERQFKVRFYCSLRMQRIHPLVIEAQPVRGSQSASGSLPVLVRPVIAGALVTPAEQVLDVAQPRAQATFHVTPLARGRLSDARVEVHSQGHLAERVRLRMKSTTQRRTWLLLALTILIPWLLLAVTHPHYWPGRLTPEPGVEYRSYGYRSYGKPLPKELRPDPGEVLAHHITSATSFWLVRFAPPVPWLHGYVIVPVASALGWAYALACNLSSDYLYLWVGAVLFSLTLLSWVSCRTQRTSRKKVVVLTAPGMQAEAVETLPLNPREEAAVAVQPVE